MTISPHSTTWLIVKKHCNKAIEACQARMETPGLDPIETENLRGWIAANRAILELAKPVPEIA